MLTSSLLAALLCMCADDAAAACRTNAVCSSNPAHCVPIATSLQPSVPNFSADVGWYAGGKCGTEGIGIFREACGNPLGVSVCGGGGGGGTCDCGPDAGSFCETSVSLDELNLKMRPLFDESTRAEPPPRDRHAARPAFLPVVRKPSQAAFERARAGLEALVGFYRELHVVTMEASAMVIREDTGKTGRGHVSFAAEADGRYRVRVNTDAHLELAPDLETSFDGTDTHLLLTQEKILSIHRNQEVDAAATAIPNPLFLPLLFLSPESDACPACALTLREAAAADLTQRLAGARGSWTKSGVAQLVLTGRRLQGRDTYFTVQVDATGRLRRIEERLSSGNLTQQVVVETYRTVAGVAEQFPFHVTVTGYERGEETGSVAYHVQQLTANDAVRETPDFVLDKGQADVVWDATLGRYLKHFQVWPPEQDF
ncbi:MAG TPA: hypothetical protein VN811_01765 [Thermoanaerobaculia bacterium]|nr:hypothetical protein [Thermoanaerobaculia bacterium]